MRHKSTSPPGEEDGLLSQQEIASPNGEDNQRAVRKRSLITHLHEWKVIYLIGLFMFLCDLGEGVRVAPEVEMLERLVCRKYFQAHDPNAISPNGKALDYLCKLDGVQSQLIELRGWLSLTRGVSQLLVVLPFRVLADHKGRRIVIALSLISLVLSGVWVVIVCEYSYALRQS